MKYLLHLFPIYFLVCTSVAQTDKVYDNLSQDELIEKAQVLIDSSASYYSKREYVASIKTNIALVKIGLKINDPKYLYYGYRYLGYDYLIISDTLLARESFMKAENIAKKEKLLKFEAETQMDLANLYSTAYEDTKRAIKYHRKSIDLFKKAKDSVGLARAYYNAIRVSVGIEEDDIIFDYLTEYEKVNHLQPKSYYIGTGNFWASYYIEKGYYQKAIESSKKMINGIKSEKYPIEISVAYENIAISYAALGNYNKAYENNLLYLELLEKEIDISIEAQSKAISSKFQVEQYQKQAEVEKEKRELQSEISAKNKQTKNILIIVCVLGFILLGALLFAYLKRRVLNEALKIKNQEYLKAKEKSEGLAKAKSKFFSTVSHELRTPLYGVIGLSTILLEDERLEAHKKDLSSLRFSADYLLALINDVLQINKIDSNDINEDVETTFNLRVLVKNIVSTFEYIRLQNKNEISVNIDSSIPQQVQGNATRISQILMNIVGNACKFTENGTIEIGLEHLVSIDGNTKIKFKVKDTGIGIAKDKQATIFDEFTQIENLQYTYQGTGLGLPIVKKLLSLSNTEIILESELKKGSTFSFVLNLKNVKTAEAIQETKLFDVSILKNKTILIAEDNRINQIVTKKILEKKGVNCVVVENGDEAIQQVKNNDFDLILMDLNMPVKNGFEATIAIRKFNQDIPIIALTAVEIEEVRNEIYFVGMNDIIVKPYDVNKFATTIAENLINPTRYYKETQKKVI